MSEGQAPERFDAAASEPAQATTGLDHGELRCIADCMVDILPGAVPVAVVLGVLVGIAVICARLLFRARRNGSAGSRIRNRQNRHPTD